MRSILKLRIEISILIKLTTFSAAPLIGGFEIITVLCKLKVGVDNRAGLRLAPCLSRINKLTPVKVAPFKSVYQGFGSGYIGRHRNVVDITESQEISLIRLVRLSCKGVSEKQEKVDLIAGYTRTDLLVSALGAA